MAHQKQNLRYEVGTDVLCRTGQNEWSRGKIIALNYRAESMFSQGDYAPYQVQLLADHRLICVPQDVPELCKKYGAPAWESALYKQDMEKLRLAVLRVGCEDTDYLGRTPLLSCLEVGWQEGALFLLAQKADPCKTAGPELCAPIHYAVMPLASVAFLDSDVDRVTFSRDGGVINARLETIDSARDDIDDPGVTFISYNESEGKLTWVTDPNEGSSWSVLDPPLRDWVPARLASLVQGTSVLTEGLPQAESKLPLVKALLEARADVNAQSAGPDHDISNIMYTSTTYSVLEQRRHRSALHYAAEAGDAGLCAQLLAARAVVDLEDRYKMTPLDVAVEKGSLKVAEVLLRGAADPNRGNIRRGLQQTTVHQVAHEGNAQLLQLLLNHGGNANAVGKQGMAPLHLAARRRHVKVVKMLLQSRGDVGQLDKSGRTPGQYAMTHQSSELGEALALDDSLQISDRIALLKKINIKQAPQHMEVENRESLPKSLHAV